MALYSYECQECGKGMDKAFPMEDCPREVECTYCRSKAKKVITLGSGGIQPDVPVWLASASEILVRHGEAPIESRCEYKRYLKDNGLVACG